MGAVDEVADVAEGEFCVIIGISIRSEKVRHFDAPIEVHMRLRDLRAAAERAIHRDKIKDNTRILDPLYGIGQEFACVVRPEDAFSLRLDCEDHRVGRTFVKCGEGSYCIIENFDGLEVLKSMHLSARPRLGIAFARREISLVLLNGCADGCTRALADIEIDGHTHTLHAAEKIGGEEVVVMVMRDEDVAHLGHIEPRKGAMMEGVNREIDRESAVKQSH